MNVFHKVTVESLKKNRVRTIVTIVGIILSAAMICAVTTFASSFYNYIGEYYKYVYGDWHGSAERVEWNTYTKIWGTGDIEEATYKNLDSACASIRVMLISSVNTVKSKENNK